MGTSKDYEAPPQWGPIKRDVTNSAGAGFLTPQKAAHIVSSFVGKMQTSGIGGFRGATAAPADSSTSPASTRRRGGTRRGGGRHRSLSRGGGAPAVARAFGSFLSDVAKRGLAQALAEAGIISVEGLTVEEIALALADALGGPASTVDDVDLRNALSALIDEITTEAKTVKDVEGAFSSAAANLEGIIEQLFSYYIYERFCTTMYAGLAERHGVTTADNYLAQIKDYIDGQLALEAATRDLTSVDWAGDEGASIVDEILDSTIEVFSVPA